MDTLIARRHRLLGAKASLFYTHPLHIVRGEGVYLFDVDGRRYLDAYNNVAHVGHCHPHVTEALCRQASTLNTHTRYLHTAILDYVERLTATLDDSLSTAILTCTGSEANDVALRMAQAATNQLGLIGTDGTYHGNTSAVSQLSVRIPPIGGQAPNVRLVKSPDSYRQDRATFAQDFARHIGEAIESLHEAGYGLSAMIVDPTMANEGLPSLPGGFFDEAIRLVRAAGGLIIVDEVQSGLGRTGRHFWGHQGGGFVPDIVTMGKPLGNGHPIGCVATTPDILATFRDAFGYFNTFAGNPVSCEVGMAVLDVLENEQLPQKAIGVSHFLETQLVDIASDHEIIGDVRANGLFVACEVVEDRKSRKASTVLADRIVNAMRERGVLIGKTGLYSNVLKIRPPMLFNKGHASELTAVFDRVIKDINQGSTR
jgi:4-aminobutyrate aminotransferase-like enzyme